MIDMLKPNCSSLIFINVVRRYANWPDFIDYIKKCVPFVERVGSTLVTYSAKVLNLHNLANF